MIEWSKAYVTVGELGVFPAQVATGISWNGAACPRFSRPVAEQIVAAATDANTRPGHEDDERLTWDKDVIVMTEPDTDSVGCNPERIEPDGDGMYAIGAYGWTWAEVWCQGEEHVGEPDDLIPPVAIMKAVEPCRPAWPDGKTILEDRAYCQACLEQARATHPQAEVMMLPPL
jgi:hypothetical protein